MTSRAAALAGLQYFADIRSIARQAGVGVPSDAAIAARFAATDSIDVQALTADAAMLSDVVVSVTGAVDTASDAHGALPDAWRGSTADAAGAAVAAHVRSAQDAADRIRDVSGTVAAAAQALTRVQDEKHRTLSMLRTDHVAGLLISTMTADDVDAHADAVRTDITAAVELFTRTMDVVDAAVSTVLTALTDSFAALPAPSESGPAHRALAPGSVHSRTDRRRRGTRSDIVPSPIASSDHSAHVTDSSVAVAAISAGATIAGSVLAAASSVGTAVVGGVGTVLNHLIDAAAPHGDAGRPLVGSEHQTRPDPTRQADPVIGSHSGTVGSASTDRAQPHVVPLAPAHTRAEPDSTPAPPRGLEPTLSAPREHVAPAPLAVPHPDAPDRAPEGSPDTGTAGDVDARGVPSSGPRSRADQVPRGRPDPGDGGGLALAGDR